MSRVESRWLAKRVSKALSYSNDETWDRLDALNIAAQDNRARVYRHLNKDVTGSSWGSDSNDGSLNLQFCFSRHVCVAAGGRPGFTARDGAYREQSLLLLG
jgi:hypothetical protein